MELPKISTGTICAISTPHGSGGIAVIRVSGVESFSIVQKIWRGKTLESMKSHTAHLGDILDSQGAVLDQALITIFRAPASYTTEDIVEISVHGSPWIQQELLKSLINAGARLAERGEFTRRAFEAGRFDLAQAEAVADLIASSSRAAHRVAMRQMKGCVSTKLKKLHEQLLELASLLELELDFSEEDVEFASRTKLIEIANRTLEEINLLTATFNAGSAIKDGIPIAIIGNTNAGKSSLLNALVGDERAIVSDIHGTTRDVIEDTITIGDYLVRLQDTAGLRQTNDKIEQIGIERSYFTADNARVIIHVIDPTQHNAEYSKNVLNLPPEKTITVINKIDLVNLQPPQGTIPVSATSGIGIDILRQEIEKHLNSLAPYDNEAVMLTNIRHAQSLKDAAQPLAEFIKALEDGIPTDLAAQLLRETLHHLDSVIGNITTPTILQSIFTRFCIGK